MLYEFNTGRYMKYNIYFYLFLLFLSHQTTAGSSLTWIMLRCSYSFFGF